MYDELVENVDAVQTTDTSNLIKKKADYNTNIDEIEKKILEHNYEKDVITQEFNKLMSGNIATRFAQAKLATKADIYALVKATDFSNKLKTIN